MARRRRVAVLVDDSPGSMRACRYGAKHLLDKDTDVMLVTAVHDSADPPAVRTASLGTSETPKARETRPLLHSDRSRTFGFSSFFTDARRACDRRFTHARFSSPSSVGPAEKNRSIDRTSADALSQESSSSEGERVCEHHAAQLLGCHLPPERIQKVIVVANGKKRETIAQAAMRGARGADHVVCGTRGLGAARSALMKAVGLGGVSHDVVRQSRVPVTVVPITAPVPEMITVRDAPRP